MSAAQYRRTQGRRAAGAWEASHVFAVSRRPRLRAAAGLTAILATTALAGERPPRPHVDALPISVNSSREQLLLGDRIFHGEAARGTCFQCHGWDGRGTATGNDLTNGSLNWGESFAQIKATILNNMKLAPARTAISRPLT